MTALRTVFDAATRAWLWLGVILLPLIAQGGGKGFLPFAFFLGCGAWIVTALNRPAWSQFRSAWFPLLLLWTLWVWATSAWSPYDDPHTLSNGLKLVVFALALAAIFIVFSRLSESARLYLGHALMAGAVLAVFGFLLDVWSGFSISILVDPIKEGLTLHHRQGEAEMEIGRGLLIYMQLFWPVAVLMALRIPRGWILAAALFIAILIAANLNRLSLAFPTLCLSAVFAALAAWRPRIGLGLAFIFAMCSLIFAPLIGIAAQTFDAERLAQLPYSWEHRLRMWAYVWERIQENWLIGNGLDASRAYTDQFTARDGRALTIVSMHPHNIGLQMWLETGLIGVALACAFIGALSLKLVQSVADRGRAMAIAGLVTVIATAGALSIGAWQYWWWGAIALSACFITLIPRKVT